MRRTVSGGTLMRRLLCLGITAALGCGNDGATNTSMAKNSAAAASSNTAGSGSAPRMDRKSATPEECESETKLVFAARPEGGYGDKCVSCLCAENALTIALCDDQADICWGLVDCVAESCSGTEGIDQANCAVSMCGRYIEGSGLAMGVGVLLRSDKCSADCASKKQ